MVNKKKLVISTMALALISTVAILAFSTPIFASAVTEQTNITYEVSTIEGEARVDGSVVGTASIEFIATPAAGEPIHFNDHSIRIFKMIQGDITIDGTTYTMVPETWEGISKVNGRRFIAIGDVVDDNDNEYIVALNGIAVAHFFSDSSTVLRLDGTLRGSDLNYHLIFIIEAQLDGIV